MRLGLDEGSVGAVQCTEALTFDELTVKVQGQDKALGAPQPRGVRERRQERQPTQRRKGRSRELVKNND